MPLVDRLYLITDRRCLPPGTLVERVARAIEGGVRLVQLREKDLDDAALLPLALIVRAVCTAGGARLIVNRNLPVALQCGADGLHIGMAELPHIAALRRQAGPDLLIGVSTHSPEEARDAQAAGADFVTLGPVFHTPSKAGMGEPLGPAEVARGLRMCSLPVFALGGVNAGCLAALQQEGIGRVAVIRAILAADDPGRAAAEFLSRLEAGP